MDKKELEAANSVLVDENVKFLEQSVHETLTQMVLKSPKMYFTPLPATLDWFINPGLPVPVVVKMLKAGTVTKKDLYLDTVVPIVRDKLRKLEASEEILGMYIYKTCILRQNEKNPEEYDVLIRAAIVRKD